MTAGGRNLTMTDGDQGENNTSTTQGGRINYFLAEVFNSISHAVVQTTHLNGPILTLSEYLSELQCGIVMAIDSSKTLCHCIQLYNYITGRLNDYLVEVSNSISHAALHTTHPNSPILTLGEYFS